MHDRSPQAPRMRTPDLNGGTGGFGWPMVNRLARATAVTRRRSGGKTVSALLAGQHHGDGTGYTHPLQGPADRPRPTGDGLPKLCAPVDQYL